MYAYCKICGRMITIPLNIDRLSGGKDLAYHLYLHSSNFEYEIHGLLILLDEGRTIRRAEPVISIHTDIPEWSYLNNIFKQEDKLKNDFYIHVIIYGNLFAAHCQIQLIDREGNIRRQNSGTVSLEEVNILPEIKTEKNLLTSYPIIERNEVDFTKGVFDQLIVIDQRLVSIISFSNTKNIGKAIQTIESFISHTTRKGTHVFSQGNDKIMLEIQRGLIICVLNLLPEYKSWLSRLASLLGMKDEIPNTLGLEVVLRIMKGGISVEDGALIDLLFSPLYMMKFTLRYEELKNDLNNRLISLFPEATQIVLPCIEGQKTLLEVLNSDLGVQHFENILKVIAFIERRYIIHHLYE